MSCFFTSVWIRVLILNAGAAIIGVVTESLSSQTSQAGPMNWALVWATWQIWTILLILLVVVIHQSVGAHLDSENQKRLEAKIDQLLANMTPQPKIVKTMVVEPQIGSPSKCRILASKEFQSAFENVSPPLKTVVNACLKKAQHIGLKKFLAWPFVHKVDANAQDIYVLRIGENRFLFKTGNDDKGPFLLLVAYMRKQELLKPVT